MNATMKTKLGYILATVVGAAVGSVATWVIAKTHYEKLIDKAVEEVKEVYCRPKVKPYTGDNQGWGPVPKHDLDPADLEKLKRTEQTADYEKRLVENGYTNYSDISSNKPKDPEPVNETPYVISPAEFGGLDGYDIRTLKYYSDDTLTDDDDNIVDEDLIGSSSLSTFGDYEDDTVYVRNERLKCDFEILRDYGRYTDVLRAKPYLADEED